MGKKERKKQVETHPKTPSAPIITARGWKIIGIGVAAVVAGFVILSFADPRGQNWAGVLSPFVIIGGYVTIGLGIVARNPAPAPPPATPTPPQG